ncbi:hypothetical protein DPMN_157931 [Dreissena polymorpha]|uniref:Uncharacterized protein n=1 Tax=Dreissena polymorpha TaxID=45954 RepID=A0A9D4EI53_DREPO|nr:hypothetical protein DPMN_157931 [Dreissena polymorpha]
MTTYHIGLEDPGDNSLIVNLLLLLVLVGLLDDGNDQLQESLGVQGLQCLGVRLGLH